MGERIAARFADGLGKIAAFLPNLISALLVLGLGYAISRLCGALVARVLSRAGFDRWVHRHVHHRATGSRSPSATLGAIVFWLGMLLASSMAASSLELPTLSAGLSRILAFVPHVLVAAIVASVGIALGNLVLGLLGGGNAWVAQAARAAIIVLSIFMALDELEIARGVVMATLVALLGAVAVAAALAFGLGNRELAGQYTRRWVRRAEEEREQVAPDLDVEGAEQGPLEMAPADEQRGPADEHAPRNDPEARH
jgi:hypothetical protein